MIVQDASGASNHAKNEKMTRNKERVYLASSKIMNVDQKGNVWTCSS